MKDYSCDYSLILLFVSFYLFPFIVPHYVIILLIIQLYFHLCFRTILQNYFLMALWGLHIKDLRFK